MPPTIQTPINIAEQDNLESVLQYHDGTVKIKFDHSKPRIPPLIKYQSSRRSFSGSSSTSKRDQDLEKEKDLEKYLNELFTSSSRSSEVKPRPILKYFSGSEEKVTISNSSPGAYVSWYFSV